MARVSERVRSLLAARGAFEELPDDEMVSWMRRESDGLTGGRLVIVNVRTLEARVRIQAIDDRHLIILDQDYFHQVGAIETLLSIEDEELLLTSAHYQLYVLAARYLAANGHLALSLGLVRGIRGSLPQAEEGLRKHVASRSAKGIRLHVLAKYLQYFHEQGHYLHHRNNLATELEEAKEWLRRLLATAHASLAASSSTIDILGPRHSATDDHAEYPEHLVRFLSDASDGAFLEEIACDLLSTKRLYALFSQGKSPAYQADVYAGLMLAYQAQATLGGLHRAFRTPGMPAVSAGDLLLATQNQARNDIRGFWYFDKVRTEHSAAHYEEFVTEVDRRYKPVAARYWKHLVPAAAAVAQKAFDQPWIEECTAAGRRMTFDQREELRVLLDEEFGFRPASQ